jgi:hypothetical protein
MNICGSPNANNSGYAQPQNNFHIWTVVFLCFEIIRRSLLRSCICVRVCIASCGTPVGLMIVVLTEEKRLCEPNPRVGIIIFTPLGAFLHWLAFSDLSMHVNGYSYCFVSSHFLNETNFKTSASTAVQTLHLIANTNGPLKYDCYPQNDHVPSPFLECFSLFDDVLLLR